MPDIHRIRFQAAPTEFVGEGKLLRGAPRGNELLVVMHWDHISKVLCEQLNRGHEKIIGTMLTHEEAPARPASDAGRVIVSGRYEFVPAAALPRGRLCWPVDADGEFIWLIKDKEMTEELRRELNAYIAESLATHQWVQH